MMSSITEPGLQNQTSCAAAFIAFLLKRIRDPNRPAITRTACAAYLASFLARAKFLPKLLLVQSLLDMATWCADYCKSQDQRQAASSFPANNAYDMGVRHQVRGCTCGIAVGVSRRGKRVGERRGRQACTFAIALMHAVPQCYTWTDQFMHTCWLFSRATPCLSN